MGENRGEATGEAEDADPGGSRLLHLTSQTEHQPRHLWPGRVSDLPATSQAHRVLALLVPAEPGYPVRPEHLGRWQPQPILRDLPSDLAARELHLL